ncbi:50S ribosomal protein L37ae [Candidatus Woesearchaeota archaeon]|nr:50S ribosomal protein L37ae [Candidatus Woesearchaeota archaeon]
MVKEKSLKSGNKFGTRYGRKNRDKFAKIENSQRKLYKCPSCHAIKVKRLSTGIWSCKKCGFTFASKAYSVDKVSIKEEIADGTV